jgi:inorganic triphosphatase YgiF
MGQEIELKLTVQPEDIDRLAGHPFVKKYSATAPVEKHLISRYFDTPGYDILTNGMALRVRYDGEKYVQTLKKRGDSQKGLTVRGEWEWQINGPQVDLKLLPPDIWPDQMRDCPDRIAPVFQTDFYRTLWRLEIPGGEDPLFRTPAKIEMALDQGVIIADTQNGPRSESILELELEIQEGDPEALFRVSEILGKEIPLSASDVSKARRGYHLLAG